MLKSERYCDVSLLVAVRMSEILMARESENCMIFISSAEALDLQLHSAMMLAQHQSNLPFNLLYVREFWPPSSAVQPPIS